MINWAKPDIAFIEECKSISAACRRFGSDTALPNIYLLSEKYNIETAVFNGAVLRRYNGKTANRSGYGFPICEDGTDIGGILHALAGDAHSRGVPLAFCLCDERQRGALDEYCRIDWQFTDDDSDYIYKRDSLALLSGKKLHRKRNHISAFGKIYDDAHYEPITPANAHDALAVAKKWLDERPDEPTAEELGEFDCITKALAGVSAIGLVGGILYVGSEPAAMTLASRISLSCVDVHYEKAWGEYAQNGAFTVINQMFAASDSIPCDYINREEDMGLPGLRTAKESYYPAFKLKKYYGVCKC